MSLSQKALGGVLWASVEKIGGKVIQFFTTIFLARILVPEDFGVVAMISIFFAISMILIDSGFSQALIREDEISEDDKVTTFYVNLIIALILFATLWYGAPYISAFFGEEILVDLTRFMGLIPIFFSFSIIQRAYYIHKINFRTQAIINLIASVLSGVSAVLLAWFGFGVWAIAAQQVLMVFVTSFLFWGVNPWMPRGFIKSKSFEKLFKFGSNLMLSGLINVIFNEIYKVIIGRLYSTELLGFYAHAENIKNVISKNLSDIMVRVTYPALSKVKDDIQRLKDGYAKILGVISIIIFPAMIGAILVAEPMIITLIGEKWLGTVPIFQLIAITGMIHHLHVINLNILKVVGRSDLILQISIIKMIGISIAIVIGLLYGFWGLMIAQVVSSFLSLFVNMYYTAKLINYTKIEQLLDVFPILLFSLPMAFTVYGLDLLQFDNEILRLLALVLSGIIIYAATCLIFKPKPFRELIYILRPKFPVFNRIKV
jgi:O-antigen/teichoic acid export membrane protein